MIVVLADAKDHEGNALQLQYFRTDAERTIRGDLFLVANTGSKDVQDFITLAGFLKTFSVKRDNVVTVCTATPKSADAVSLTKESDTLHSSRFSRDRKKKASVVITRCEAFNSGLGPVRVANVSCGREFSSVEAVRILQGMAPLLLAGNIDRAIIAFHIASPITADCERAMDALLERGHYYLFKDSADARPHLRNGVLISNNLSANTFGTRSAFYTDKNDGVLKPFVLEFFILTLRRTPAVDPVVSDESEDEKDPVKEVEKTFDKKIPMGLWHISYAKEYAEAAARAAARAASSKKK